MKRLKKRIVWVLTLLLVFWGTLGGMVQNIEAADFEESSYMRYWTNNYYAYNVEGNVGGSWLQTTYGSGGYGTRLVVDGSNFDLNYLQNGVEKLYNGDLTGVTQTLSLTNEGRYVKIQYVIRNLSEVPQVISLASHTDVQIGGNDSAPIYSFPDWSGFYMTDGSTAQFNFIGKNAYGVTNVDTYWYGVYYNRSANLFNQIASPSLTGTDSGMAFSWKDRTIQPGGSLTLSVLLGLGNVNAAPALTVAVPASAFGDVAKGESAVFSGTVTDAENSINTKVYYAIDDTEPVLAYTFEAAPGAFTSEIMVPAETSLGAHEVTFYAQDTDGAISSSVSRTMNVIDSLDVTFNSNGGTEVAPLTDLESGSLVTRPTDPTKEGSVFAGWFKDAQLSVPWVFETDTVTVDTTLYAKWNLQTFAVSFNTGGGSAMDPLAGMASGSLVSLTSAPTRTGYQFAGWYKDAALTQAWNFSTDTVVSDMTLYARWLPLVQTQQTIPPTGDNSGAAPIVLMILAALGALYYSARRILFLR